MHPLTARTLTVALAAGLLLGCSPAADPTTQVRAAEDVFSGAPQVVADISGTSATLRVTTTMDLACAVVFGTTPELGDGIATDADMGGGAHDAHEAVMHGLVPDTEYHYRVQGSGADGGLYQSELMTFRTPPAEAAETPGDNVAVGATVLDVSSEFSPSFAAPHAVDGDPATEWSSDGDGDDAALTIDLGAEVDVVGVGYRSRSMSDGTAEVSSFTVTVDGGEVLGPFPAGQGLTVTEVVLRGRQLRFDAEETTGGNTGAVEVEVYAAPADS